MFVLQCSSEFIVFRGHVMDRSPMFRGHVMDRSPMPCTMIFRIFDLQTYERTFACVLILPGHF
jgi:hypothetical protein